MSRQGRGTLCMHYLWAFLYCIVAGANAAERSLSAPGSVVELTFETHRHYADPFNDVAVDVVFEKDGRTWRVPTFWRGGEQWTVRFAAPIPGTYTYHLESTDQSNPDLNGKPERISVAAYTGDNPLLRHGMLRVSSNHRYFEHADGTPFFWLGDTWWTGLSDRLAWVGFQELTIDRQGKGFSVVQICGGLVPSFEEVAPTDPGFCNEGGCVWDAGFKRINPRYFDYVDRRIQYLLAHGLVPAIVGGWRGVLAQMGVSKMEQHWRYLIARYGAYPVFWIAGGEVYDPPPSQSRQGLRVGKEVIDLRQAGWTQIVRFIRATDPYHHPLTVHEVDPPFDSAIQDGTLTDFDLFQAGHRGWPSIATEIALLDKHYARTTVTKPLVVGEVGYEGIFDDHREDFQRAAFWLGMLNGAAGHTYGAVGTWESYGSAKPFHRLKISFKSWREGMALPGSYQVGLGAKLLQKYRWSEIQPHPEWVSPHGTTLLEPNSQISGFDIDLIQALADEPLPSANELPLGEWHNVHGNWRSPYAAGIPRRLRLIYLPYFGFTEYPRPVINGIEAGARYHAYYWEPALGIKVDLGLVHGPRGSAAGYVDISHLERKLYDAGGHYRGRLAGPKWQDFGTHQRVQGSTYSPEPPPSAGDWVLVLEAVN